MKWTTEAPTESGWYWFRCDGDIDTVIICQDAGPKRELTCRYHTRAFAILLEQIVRGEWWPEKIEPPEDK